MTIPEFIKKYASHISLQTKKPFIEVKEQLTDDLTAVVVKHNIDNKGFRCLIFHKWSKWEQFNVEIPGNYHEIKQRKVCLNCNKVQEQFVEFANKG